VEGASLVHLRLIGPLSKKTVKGENAAASPLATAAANPGLFMVLLLSGATLLLAERCGNSDRLSEGLCLPVALTSGDR
jgi:hypothetical protein